MYTSFFIFHSCVEWFTRSIRSFGETSPSRLENRGNLAVFRGHVELHHADEGASKENEWVAEKRVEDRRRRRSLRERTGGARRRDALPVVCLLPEDLVTTTTTPAPHSSTWPRVHIYTMAMYTACHHRIAFYLQYQQSRLEITFKRLPPDEGTLASDAYSTPRWTSPQVNN